MVCPTNESCTKMYRRRGVIVQVRCTVCGETFLIMTELSRDDMQTKTSFTMKGEPVGGATGKPIWCLTLDDLLDADEYVNANGERGRSADGVVQTACCG